MNAVRKFLIFVLILVGISSIAGGLVLMIGSDLAGIPVEWLQPVFTSFFWPGMILAVVVGGTHIVAAVLLWRNSPFALYATAKAGFALVIWVFVELSIIKHTNWLQWLYFGFGIYTLVATMLLQSKAEERYRGYEI